MNEVIGSFKCIFSTMTSLSHLIANKANALGLMCLNRQLVGRIRSVCIYIFYTETNLLFFLYIKTEKLICRQKFFTGIFSLVSLDISHLQKRTYDIGAVTTILCSLDSVKPSLYM